MHHVQVQSSREIFSFSFSLTKKLKLKQLKLKLKLKKITTTRTSTTSSASASGTVVVVLVAGSGSRTRRSILNDINKNKNTFPLLYFIFYIYRLDHCEHATISLITSLAWE